MAKSLFQRIGGILTLKFGGVKFHKEANPKKPGPPILVIPKKGLNQGAVSPP